MNFMLKYVQRFPLALMTWFDSVSPDLTAATPLPLSTPHRQNSTYMHLNISLVSLTFLSSLFAFNLIEEGNNFSYVHKIFRFKLLNVPLTEYRISCGNIWEISYRNFVTYTKDFFIHYHAECYVILFADTWNI